MTKNTTQQALDAALAECERFRADAERYQWLCEFREWPDDVSAALDCSSKVLIDAVIDAARGKP